MPNKLCENTKEKVFRLIEISLRDLGESDSRNIAQYIRCNKLLSRKVALEASRIGHFLFTLERRGKVKKIKKARRCNIWSLNKEM